MKKRKPSVKLPNTENKDKQIYFLCAMPRSGNTLFASIMNQNPELVVTPNSIVLEIMKDLFLLKKIYNDGTFDDKNVDTHQLLSYKKIMKNRKNTLTPGSSQPEVFNVLGQMQSIERIEEERKALGHESKKAISETPKYGKQG